MRVACLEVLVQRRAGENLRWGELGRRGGRRPDIRVAGRRVLLGALHPWFGASDPSCRRAEPRAGRDPVGRAGAELHPGAAPLHRDLRVTVGRRKGSPGLYQAGESLEQKDGQRGRSPSSCYQTWKLGERKGGVFLCSSNGCRARRR